MLSHEFVTDRRAEPATSGWSIPPLAITSVALVAEIVVLVAVGVITGLIYHSLVYTHAGIAADYAEVAVLASLGYTMNFAVRGEYSVDHILDGERGNARILWAWCLAFVGLAAIGFLTKSTATFSRGWLISFFATGLIAAVALNALVYRVMTRISESGRLRRRRLMLVGTSADVERLDREIADGSNRVHVAARTVLPADATEDETERLVSAALANARQLHIEDVVVAHTLAPALIERCVAAFSMLPVALHLTAGGLISRFKDARVSRFGRNVSLSLTREPMRTGEAASKRAFDVVASILALVLLSPLFALIALAIRIDSPGPVFFRQRRRGYNHVEFSIFKFRTMTTLEDGDTIEQARVDDARVTAIGRFLRNSSLDELPQLLNVVMGHMSLVGPRPHAVAHDRFFEALIPVYPRRLNVKPGITGWAQVNGFRGATQTQDAMSSRVEHDLYYIDNWSVAFDLYILLLTVFSPKARSNAF